MADQGSFSSDVISRASLCLAEVYGGNINCMGMNLPPVNTARSCENALNP